MKGVARLRRKFPTAEVKLLSRERFMDGELIEDQCLVVHPDGRREIWQATDWASCPPQQIRKDL